MGYRSIPNHDFRGAIMATNPAENNPEPAAPANPKRGGKRVLKAVLMILAAVVAVFLSVVAMQPAEYRVVRSATMNAPPEAVYAQVENFHKWEAWSPWSKLDPAAKNTFEGPDSGPGAVFRWAGNADVGEGSMTISEARPYEQIRIELAFIKPFEDKANVEFTFQPVGEQTAVTWSMDGRNNFIGRIFCLFMNMDEMIGSKYEEGLASLKSIVEAAPKEENPAASETTEEKPEQPGSET
jgi:hypothetical protein